MTCLELPGIAGSKDMILTHYSTLNFKAKMPQYWEKGKEGFRPNYHQWCILLNIRHIPDEFVLTAVQNTLIKDYGHLNENSVTDAIKMNLRNEFTPAIEAFQLLNEHFLIKLLSAYDKKLREVHKMAVNARDKALTPPEPTPEETEAKNIKAMKSVFAEFKQTGNESLISGRYYEFFNDRGMIKFTGAEKRGFMETARKELKTIKTAGEGLLKADKILKEIEGGGMVDEVVAVAKRITVIEFFKSIDTLEL